MIPDLFSDITFKKIYIPIPLDTLKQLPALILFGDVFFESMPLNSFLKRYKYLNGKISFNLSQLATYSSFGICTH